MNITHNNRLSWIIVVLLCYISFFANNGALTPDIMESRNIVTAREMVSDGNGLVPTMNGELRLEKPPLPTWVAGAIEYVCPDNLPLQRTAAGIMGCLWVLFVYLYAREVSRRKEYALLVTAVFITMYQVILMGRTATWDIYCHAFMMGAIYFLSRGLYEERFYEERHTWKWFCSAGIMMGLSFLSKGPVSFYALLLPYLIAMITLYRPSMKGKWAPLVVMIVICLVISSWWYIYLLIFHSDSVRHVMGKESSSWINHNVRPWYYYWRFFTETGAWTIFMLAALVVPYWKKRSTMKRQYVFTITWTLAALVLLSLMPEKKMRYLLPMMPPCALTIGTLLLYYVDKRPRNIMEKALFYTNGIVIGIIAIAIPAVVFFMKINESMDAWQFIASCIILPLLGIYTIVKSVRIKVRKFIYSVLAIFAVAETILLGNIGEALGNPERRALNEISLNKELNGIPFYHPNDEELRIELVYDARRKILPIDIHDAESVRKAVPCVIVSQRPLKEILPKELTSKIDTTGYGVFDNNLRSKNGKHYSEILVNHVTMIKNIK